MSEGEWTRVAAVDEIPPGSKRMVEAGAERLVLVNLGGDFYALEDRCSHQDFPLSDGFLEGDQLECIYHGARFDVRSGRALQLPAIRAVKTYDVEVRDGEIFVRTD